MSRNFILENVINSGYVVHMMMFLPRHLPVLQIQRHAPGLRVEVYGGLRWHRRLADDMATKERKSKRKKQVGRIIPHVFYTITLCRSIEDMAIRKKGSKHKKQADPSFSILVNQ